MGHGDYELQEFATRLAEVESRFAKELQAVIECFVQSRADLPAKRLEEMSKCHARRAKNLKKAVDPKKSDGVNLWKVTNVFSTACVEEDDAMRDVRAALKKFIRKESTKIRVNGDEVSTYRRVADDYRPLIARGKSDAAHLKKPLSLQSSASSGRGPSPPTNIPSSGPPEEIYDVEKPSLEEKQQWLEQWRRSVEQAREEEKEKEEIRRRLEKRQSMKIFGSANLSNLSSKLFGDKRSTASPAPSGAVAEVTVSTDYREAGSKGREAIKVHPASQRTPSLAAQEKRAGKKEEVVVKF